MQLYPYQQKIFDATIEYFKKKNRVMVVVPTGGGKTVIFSYLAKYFGLKTLLVAHTKELIDQAKKTAKIVGVKNIEIMSIQRAGCRLKRGLLDRYDFLIIDECHRSGANSYQRILDYCKDCKVLGVTATPFRSDGKKLESIFDQRISPLGLIEMINQGLLCDFKGYRIKTDISLKGVSTKRGDFIESRLAPVINVKNRNALIVREYKKISPEDKTLCFAVNINHAEALAKEFRESGIQAEAVHGKYSKKQREEILRRFKEGSLRVLVNCQVLTEGFDEPSVTCVLMARPTCSKILYTQMIGRGSRLYPGKDICKIIEFTDNEYDVCSIEELVSEGVSTLKIKQGETISSFEKRTKELLEDSEVTITEEMQIIPKTIYEKEATPWQREFLQRMKIKFMEPLTEIVANQLITKAVNG